MDQKLSFRVSGRPAMQSFFANNTSDDIARVDTTSLEGIPVLNIAETERITTLLHSRVNSCTNQLLGFDCIAA